MSDDHHSDDNLQALYREGATERPGPDLDQRILAAARHGAATRRGTRDLRRMRWRLPAAGFATAAVVVLAAVLALRTQLPTAPDIEAQSAPAPPASAKRNAAAEQSAPAPPAAEAQPPGTAKALPDRQADGLAGRPLEEMMTAGQRFQAAAEAQRRERGDLPAARLTSGTPSVSLRAPHCERPYTLPEGATLTAEDDGAEVELGGDTFKLRCVDGAWVVEDDQSATGSDDHSGDRSNR